MADRNDLSVDSEQDTITREEYHRLAKAGKAHVVPRSTAPPPRKKAKSTPLPTTPQFRCHACGEENKALAAAERHALANGHNRIENIP